MRVWKSLIIIASAITLGFTSCPEEENEQIEPVNELKEVRVFLPKLSETNFDLDYVEPVIRTTPRRDVEEFAIEQVIAGPNETEKEEGFTEAMNINYFVGESNCGGENFTLAISQGVAILQFCRAVATAGIGDDVRISSSLEATLKEFDRVNSVVILNRNGDCFKDLSGENLCLKNVPE